MLAAVVLVFNVLVHGSLQNIKPEQALTSSKTQQITELYPSASDFFENKSFEDQTYQNQSRYDRGINIQNHSFGQRITSRSPWHFNTTSKPTTEYVPEIMDYPISGGEPVSTFTFDNYPGSIPLTRPLEDSSGQLVALPLGETGAPKADVDRWRDPNDKETNVIYIDPNWKPDTGNTKNIDNERLPWQFSVFSKREQPFKRICGASKVSRTTLISAAHCFWSEGEGLIPAPQFAVGAGKVLTYAQDDYSTYLLKNDLGSITIPPAFNGTNQHDLAVLKLAGPFYVFSGIRPVCISFENEQLAPGNIATTLGAGVLKDRRTPLQTLRVPYVPWEECKRALGDQLTEDMMCAGFKPGMSPVLGEICTRDAGAGLAFYLGDKQDEAKGIAVPFLRGVASRSRPCDARDLTVYTRLSSYKAFLEENIEGLEGVVEECGKYYPQLGALLARHAEAKFVCDCYC